MKVRKSENMFQLYAIIRNSKVHVLMYDLNIGNNNLEETEKQRNSTEKQHSFGGKMLFCGGLREMYMSRLSNWIFTQQ